MVTSSSTPQAVVGILSLGEMGTGIAALLMANDYNVATCTAGRRYVARPDADPELTIAANTLSNEFRS